MVLYITKFLILLKKILNRSRYLDKIVRAELTSDERGAFLNELKQGLKRSSYLTV